MYTLWNAAIFFMRQAGQLECGAISTVLTAEQRNNHHGWNGTTKGSFTRCVIMYSTCLNPIGGYYTLLLLSATETIGAYHIHQSHNRPQYFWEWILHSLNRSVRICRLFSEKYSAYLLATSTTKTTKQIIYNRRRLSTIIIRNRTMEFIFH